MKKSLFILLTCASLWACKKEQKTTITATPPPSTPLNPVVGTIPPPTNPLPDEKIVPRAQHYKIEPPIHQADKPFELFDIDNLQTHSLKLPSGSTLTIPAEAFVTNKGDIIEGNIQLKYREFHDAADIFLSGIPMEIKTPNGEGHLQTAGMFEIRAVYEGEEVMLDKGKKIQVELASSQKGEGYGSYYLDENNENDVSWIYIGKSEKKANTHGLNIKNQKEELEDEGLRVPLGKQYFCFNFYAILDVEYEDDWKVFADSVRQIPAHHKAIKYGLQHYNVRCNAEVKYQGNGYPAGLMLWKYHEEVRIPEWVNQGCSVAVTPTQEENVYHLVIDSDERKFDVYIECVMPLKDLFAFTPEFWNEHYREAMAKILEEEKRVGAEASLLRVMQVDKMGIFNFDKLMKESQYLVVHADFQPARKLNTPFQPHMVFCIPQDNSSVIKLPYADWDKVALLPNQAAKFIMVLPENKIGVFSAQRYARLPIDSLKKVQQPSYLFTMVASQQAITNASDLRTLLR